MFKLTSLLSILVVAQGATSSPIRSRTPYSVKETHFVPPKWREIGEPVDGSTISLNIGLKQSQFGELERHLYEGMQILRSFLLPTVAYKGLGSFGSRSRTLW